MGPFPSPGIGVLANSFLKKIKKVRNQPFNNQCPDLAVKNKYHPSSFYYILLYPQSRGIGSI
jgi:hypothetical protein